ncbi:TetR/AcrR family transcriptional regulator [Pseudomonas paraeruginosa]|uniref:TetR/AcrR family transcriptional regulator n=1 Tax=Pseudomonas aeruginosa TaxID=287 RepID=UPI0021E4B671|nr:TetR/AcrR family transcriptional regulator [Pseudomonas aeruginosa]MCV2495060.1 TetR/AcrR family transcriptional regulator [Pseudomonas aeruginosa]
MVSHPRATMRELAELAGVSRATLNRHCGTRERLRRRLESHARSTLERLIRDAARPRLEPRAALRELIREHLAHRDLLALLMCEQNPGHQAGNEDAGWQAHIEALDAFFLRGQQKGVFRIDITAAVFTELFLTLIYGLVDAERRGRAASANSAQTLEQMFLHGAANPARP